MMNKPTWKELKFIGKVSLSNRYDLVARLILWTNPDGSTFEKIHIEKQTKDGKFAGEVHRIENTPEAKQAYESISLQVARFIK